MDRLQKCVMGEIEMSSTQIQAARILLNKVLPDLKAVEISDINPVDDIRNLSIDQALSLIDGSRN